MKIKFLTICVFSSLFPIISVHAGEVTTDGSMGTATNLTGPNYTISQDLGATVGNNLFHSFGTFNLSQGDVATFTGANTIQNVISRVTDGNPSSIDGTIESQVGNANFFFINPAGVVFGQHAVVDVPAAFHASTANELRFADGTAYNLVTPKGSLTAAPPEAFGFLGNTGNIVIEGSQLKFKEGAEVSFTGGSVTSNNATIEVPRGSLRVYGNGDAVSNVPITGKLPSGNGAINMSGGKWDVSGNGGGNIEISGGEVNITDEAKVSNDNNGSLDAFGVLRIDANTLLIDGQNTSISSSGPYLSIGDAGKININIIDNMRVLNGGRINSSTFVGHKGSISINVGKLLLMDNGRIIADGIISHGGIIHISSPVIVLLNSIISATGLGEYVGVGGNGGNITLNGNYLVLNTGFIRANSRGQKSHGGNIYINMDGLLSNGGVTEVGDTEHEFVPNSGLNVIQAKNIGHWGGENGTITFSNPNNDTASSIGANSNRLEPIKLAKHPCEGIKGRFNFRRRGDVGLPNSGGDIIQSKQPVKIDNEAASLSHKLHQQTVCAAR